MQYLSVNYSEVSRPRSTPTASADASSEISLVALYEWLVFFSVFISLIQFLVITLSMLGPYVDRAGSLAVLAIAFAVAFWTRQHARRSHAPFVVQNSEPLFSARAEYVFFLLTGFLLLGFSALAFSGRDVSWDGNAYHILPINQWAVKNRIHEISSQFATSLFINGYPKGAEVVTLVFVQAFGSWCLTGLNIFYAPLGLFGTAVLCRLCGGTCKQSLLFGALYLLVPAIGVQYGTTYVDAAFAFSIAAFLALLACRFVFDDRNWLVGLLPAGCAMGSVLAVKASGIAIVAVSCTSFLFCSMFSRKLFAWRSRPLGKDVLWLGSCIAVALMIGGFWYLRNWWCHGSPLYPAGLTIAGKTVFPGPPVSEVIAEYVNTPPNIRRLGPLLRVLRAWGKVLKWNYYDTKEDIRLGGLGLTWVLGCVPALIGAAFTLKTERARDPGPKLLFSFLALAIILAFLATPMNWWARYTVWLYALGLPACWVAWAGIRDSKLKRAAQAWALICTTILIVQSGGILAERSRFAAAQAGIHLKTILPDLTTGPLPIFPTLKSPVLSRMMNEGSAIGIGPTITYNNISSMTGYVTQIYGQLAQPVGRHELFALSENVSESDLRALSRDNHVRYIMWPVVQPIPAAMTPHVSELDREDIFMYLELRRDSFD